MSLESIWRAFRPFYIYYQITDVDDEGGKNLGGTN